MDCENGVKVVTTHRRFQPLATGVVNHVKKKTLALGFVLQVKLANRSFVETMSSLPMKVVTMALRPKVTAATRHALLK
jgi:hypothetical protein